MGTRRVSVGLAAIGFGLRVWLVAVAASSAPSTPVAIKDSVCLECHADKTLATTNTAGREVSLFVDVAKLTASVHKTNTCASCHADITIRHPDDNVRARAVDCMRCHEKQSETYGASVHGLASARGELAAATCSDCHDGHTILPPTSPE